MPIENSKNKPCKKCGSLIRYKNGKCKPCHLLIKAKYRAQNIKAIDEYQARYRELHREEIRERQSLWKSENKQKVRIFHNNRRAREFQSGGKLSAGIAEKLFTMQRGMCACGCGRRLGKDYHIDHIMPLALGGTNTDDNIQLLIAGCNLKKGTKHPIEFMQSIGFLL